MSSMWRIALTIPLFLVAATTSSAQHATSATYPPGSTYVPAVAPAIEQWRTLRQSSGYRFADYATFLIANPGWPGEASIRRWAERAMQPGENAGTVITFFATEKPRTGKGWARLADAYAASGQMAAALDAARNAWASDDLSDSDEQAIWDRYSGSFTRADHDRRVDSLLFAKKASDAASFIAYASPQRQAAFGARVAMLRDDADAESRYAAVIGTVTGDAGLMMDRARYLRSKNFNRSAQDLAARTHNFIYRPADPARFYDMLLLLANDAAADRDWSTAYKIASQLDDALPPGQSVADQPFDVRDNYTTLAWFAGNVALDRTRHPSNALAMYDRYARASQSLQVQTKGWYWAGRAALAGGRYDTASAYFQRAAAYPDLFYGQLALERLGRTVTAPPPALPQYVTTPAQRAAFNNRRLVQAVRVLRQQGRTNEETLFVRALAESLHTDSDRYLALNLSQELSRPDLAVWTTRLARIDGSAFYFRQAFPTLPASVSSSLWSLAHGISRQESSFDPYAVSHAGARGMMQLMTGTAREQAGKMGVGYDGYRLISDPSYNVMLGSAYFQRMLDMWNGSIPLAVASYNAGYGNVRKWVRAYGDPRGQVDMLKWIEAIPYTETKGYVQRVIENSVVYDSMRPYSQERQAALHVSRYLGMDRPA
jgi:soluble lytic murein transglycosylase